MGAHIVYGDLSRVIVCTNKLNVEDAVTYLKYLLSNVQGKELFSTIHIDTNKIWTLLMWQDSANYGGLKITLSDDESKVNKSFDFEHKRV